MQVTEIPQYSFKQRYVHIVNKIIPLAQDYEWYCYARRQYLKSKKVFFNCVRKRQRCSICSLPSPCKVPQTDILQASRLWQEIGKKYVETPATVST